MPAFPGVHEAKNYNTITKYTFLEEGALSAERLLWLKSTTRVAGHTPQTPKSETETQNGKEGDKEGDPKHERALKPLL